MYTIGQKSEMFQLPISTLRYYDKEGLLPFVERSEGGIRMFKDSDIEWLNIIECLKKTGMSIKEIKKFIKNLKIKCILFQNFCAVHSRRIKKASTMDCTLKIK